MGYIKRKSQKQEARTAKDFGGRTQVASGAIWSAKADVRTGDRGTGFNQDDFLIENKFTDSDAYKLERKTWEKISREALNDNFRTPLMQIDVQDLQLVAMDFNDYIGFFKGYNVHKLEAVAKQSIPIKKSIIETLIDEAREHGKIPVYLVEFMGSTARRVQNLRVVIMEKDEFINR
jgi:hypothetical protein